MDAPSFDTLAYGFSHTIARPDSYDPTDGMGTFLQLLERYQVYVGPGRGINELKITLEKRDDRYVADPLGNFMARLAEFNGIVDVSLIQNFGIEVTFAAWMVTPEEVDGHCRRVFEEMRESEEAGKLFPFRGEEELQLIEMEPHSHDEEEPHSHED